MPATIRNAFARQAISTRYLGPTNSRGARVVASAEAGRKIYSWDYALDAYANHAAAALQFAQEWGWDGEYVGGGTADGYCFCRIEN